MNVVAAPSIVRPATRSARSRSAAVKPVVVAQAASEAKEVSRRAALSLTAVRAHAALPVRSTSRL